MHMQQALWQYLYKLLKYFIVKNQSYLSCLTKESMVEEKACSGTSVSAMICNPWLWGLFEGEAC